MKRINETTYWEKLHKDCGEAQYYTCLTCQTHFYRISYNASVNARCLSQLNATLTWRRIERHEHRIRFFHLFFPLVKSYQFTVTFVARWTTKPTCFLFYCRGDDCTCTLCGRCRTVVWGAGLVTLWWCIYYLPSRVSCQCLYLYNLSSTLNCGLRGFTSHCSWWVFCDIFTYVTYCPNNLTTSSSWPFVQSCNAVT